MKAYSPDLVEKCLIRMRGMYPYLSKIHKVIVERMMLPMLLECSRCLEDSIVKTPVEVDMALVYGLGFPPFRGGIFRWADTLGAAAVLSAAEKHAAQGPLYAPTQQLKALAAAGKPFHAA